MKIFHDTNYISAVISSKITDKFTKTRLLYTFVIYALFVTCVGCSSVAYYTQSISGQLHIISLSEPIEILLRENRLSPHLAAQLEQAQQIRDFASTHLNLPENRSYRYFADLDREYVVWNVFAAPPTAMQAREWCYIIAGCLGYRGYFKKEQAIAYQNVLNEQGFDTWVGGVTAYSTLGWFTDPVLNTMLFRDDYYLAKTIFHELAHQKIYIKNDTAVNEAFAETIAIEGVKRWLISRGDQRKLEEFDAILLQDVQFDDLVLEYRDKLKNVYDSHRSEAEKLVMKHEIFQHMQQEYQQMKTGWKYGQYDSWFASGLNNAKLLAVSTYRQFVPAMQEKLEMMSGDIDAFYLYIESLKICPPERRKSLLENKRSLAEC